MDTKIKVYYYPYGIQKEKDPCYLLWNTVQKELEKEGYQFIFYEGKKEPDWSGLFDKLDKGEYDIVIAPMLYNKERMLKSEFTFPFGYLESSLQYYKPKVNFTLLFIQKVTPIIIFLILLSLLISYISYKYKGSYRNFIYTFYSFFGLTSRLININNNKSLLNIVINILIYIIIFYISISLISILIAKTIHYKSFIDNISSLKNKKIVISSGDARIKYLKDNDAIPIIYGDKEKQIYKNSLDFYLANYKKYNGVYFDGWELLQKKNVNNEGVIYKYDNKKYLLLSSVVGNVNNLIGFPMNKKKEDFVNKVQYYLTKFIFSGYSEICKPFISCPNLYL